MSGLLNMPEYAWQGFLHLRCTSTDSTSCLRTRPLHFAAGNILKLESNALWRLQLYLVRRY